MKSIWFDIQNTQVYPKNKPPKRESFVWSDMCETMDDADDGDAERAHFSRLRHR